jgi:hypothetical protein
MCKNVCNIGPENFIVFSEQISSIFLLKIILTKCLSIKLVFISKCRYTFMLWRNKLVRSVLASISLGFLYRRQCSIQLDTIKNHRKSFRILTLGTIKFVEFQIWWGTAHFKNVNNGRGSAVNRTLYGSTYPG